MHAKHHKHMHAFKQDTSGLAVAPKNTAPKAKPPPPPSNQETGPKPKPPPPQPECDPPALDELATDPPELNVSPPEVGQTLTDLPERAEGAEGERLDSPDPGADTKKRRKEKEHSKEKKKPRLANTKFGSPPQFHNRTQ